MYSGIPPTSHPEPPTGRLARLFFVLGYLPAVPVFSVVLVRVLALTGLFDGWSELAGFLVWIGAWMVCTGLFLHLVNLVDAWDARRCLQRHSSQGGSPVFLSWRNRLLVNGRNTCLRRVAWFYLGPGNWIFVLPVLTAGCLIDYWLVSIDEHSTSAGPDPVLAVFFVGAAIVLAAITVHCFWERVRVIRKSRLLTATVVDGGLRDSCELYIDYCFLTPAGEKQAGSERLSCRPCPMPFTGDHLVILYDEQMGAQVM